MVLSEAEMTPQKQIWWLMCCHQDSLGTSVDCGGSFTPLAWGGKRGFKLFGLLWLTRNTVDVSQCL